MTDDYVGPKVLPPGGDKGDVNVSDDGQTWVVEGISGVALTADKAAITSGAGLITTSSTSSTQIGYLSTTVSDVQIQINYANMENTVNVLRCMGSDILALTMNSYGVPPTVSRNMTDNAGDYAAIYIPRTMTITGARFFMQVQGNYTADQNNYVALYSYNASTGVADRVAISDNNGDVWKATLRSFFSVPFHDQYIAAPGVYFIGVLYNNSAQVTAPALLYNTGYATSAMLFGLPNSGKTSFNTGSNNTLPTSITLSVASNNTSSMWAALY